MKRSLFALLLVSVCRLGFASEDVTQSTVGIQCEGSLPVNVPNFGKLAEASATINRDLCEAIFNPLGEGSRAELVATEAQWRETLLNFAETSRTQALRIAKVVSIEHFDRPFVHLREKLSQGDINSLALPGFSVDRGVDGSFMFHFSDRAESARIPMAHNEACQDQFQVTCGELLQEYRRAFIQYKRAYSRMTADRTLDQIDDLSEDWREFLATARSQTLLDLGLTTKRESDHFKQGYLVGPPGRQWFFLHPNIVYEHLSTAADGFETEPGVGLEVVGINWWEKGNSPIYYPFGVSLTTTFIDRPDTNDLGVGLMFHINNRFSIGWANYSGDDSIYVSADLLSLFNDKREVFGEYRGRMVE